MMKHPKPFTVKVPWPIIFRYGITHLLYQGPRKYQESVKIGQLKFLKYYLMENI